MSRRCHAHGCTIAVVPEMLMCSRHWFMVPKDIRDKVWATYRPGHDKNPSEEWRHAADEAIAIVAKKEGR